MSEVIVSLLTTEMGFIIQVLITIAIGTKVFSMMASACLKEENRRAVLSLINGLKALANKFNSANQHVNEPSLRRRKAGKWIEAGTYCLFSAYFWVVAIAMLTLFAVSEMTGLKGTLAMLFTVALMLVANMYHVAAQKIKVELDSIDAQ